ncbi:hypothetical protein A9W99_05140 [Mycobacterium sp. 1164966.3]|uniref:lipoprotein LpqH n=1 Tax=Mycobacterium sp. 1164966.3 TaxID=1856861 RepID=UPI00080080F1|nr:lipoprotein LpqH [Mycobacterium sp. 1164966.3]OBA84191.1 hypothetical protein A9W99_05140 [Mycobacterium sp. 1164966.3]
MLAIGGAAIAVAFVAACGDSGKIKLLIESQEQNIDHSNVRCRPDGAEFVIGSAETYARLNQGDPPEVNSYLLGTFDGVQLSWQKWGTTEPAPAVTKDGKTYKISGTATGATRTMQEQGVHVSKKFELDVTCP